MCKLTGEKQLAKNGTMGAPNIKLDILENLARKRAVCVLEERKEEIQRSADEEIPNCI